MYPYLATFTVNWIPPYSGLQTPLEYLPDVLILSSPFAQSITFVLPMFTRSPLISRSFFHISKFSTNVSNVSVINWRSSMYRSFHGQPVQNSLDSTSWTIVKISELERTLMYTIFNFEFITVWPIQSNWHCYTVIYIDLHRYTVSLRWLSQQPSALDL